MSADAAARSLARLRAARTRLAMERPFLGALAMHLELAPASPAVCATTGTDGRVLLFNPAWIEGLSLAETQFVVAHEALHCALGHFARRGHRMRRRWDVACDHAVNLLLADDGLKPLAGALLDIRHRGLSAEEIYPSIPEDTRDRPFDLHRFDGRGDGSPAGGFASGEALRAGPGDDGGGPGAAGDRPGEGDLAREAAAVDWTGGGGLPGEREDAGAPPLAVPGAGAAGEDLAQAWQMRLAAAAQQALRAGRLGESWLRALDALIAPRVPWRALLARHLVSVAREDYSFQRPSRRQGEAILPGLRSGSLDLVVAIDTSGSITAPELAEFVSELDGLKGQVRARVSVLACDERLAPGAPWVFEAWEPIELPRDLAGGGGTRFTPVFDWVVSAALRPDLLVYFTDGEGEFPPAEPVYPVVWLVKGRAPVPWGERVQMG